jgi:hypothetical protein
MPRIGAFKPARMSVDNPTVKVWKMRAILYGLLAVLAVLVLAARPGDGEPPRLLTLRGTTAQGAEVQMRLEASRVYAFSITAIWAHCPGGRAVQTAWTPIVIQGNVRYETHGERIAIYESTAAMHARVYNGGHDVDGTISYTPPGCDPHPVRFSATG